MWDASQSSTDSAGRWPKIQGPGIQVGINVWTKGWEIISDYEGRRG